MSRREVLIEFYYAKVYHVTEEFPHYEELSDRELQVLEQLPTFHLYYLRHVLATSALPLTGRMRLPERGFSVEVDIPFFTIN